MTLLYEPEPTHWCLEELAQIASEKLQPWDRPTRGAIARCTCGRFFVVDERSGEWKRLPRWSRRVREAMAHHDERHRGGTSEP